MVDCTPDFIPHHAACVQDLPHSLTVILTLSLDLETVCRYDAEISAPSVRSCSALICLLVVCFSICALAMFIVFVFSSWTRIAIFITQ